MTALAARTQAKQLLDFVPDDKITYIVRYIEAFTVPAKQPAINQAKKAAFEALLADVKPVPGQNPVCLLAKSSGLAYKIQCVCSQNPKDLLTKYS